MTSEKLTEQERLAIALGKHHKKLEEQKGFLPPPPPLIREVSKLLDIAARHTQPNADCFTYTRRAILRELARHAPLFQGEVAKKAHLSAPAVSNELAVMEREGLIRREKDPADGRAMLLYLTKQGIDMEQRMRQTDLALDSWVMHDLSVEDQKQLSTLLVKLRNRLVCIPEENTDE